MKWDITCLVVNDSVLTWEKESKEKGNSFVL